MSALHQLTPLAQRLGTTFLVAPSLGGMRDIAGGRAVTIHGDARQTPEFWRFPGVDGLIGFGTTDLTGSDVHWLVIDLFPISVPSGGYAVIGNWQLTGSHRQTLFLANGAAGYTDLSYGKTGSFGGSDNQVGWSLSGVGGITGARLRMALRRAGVTRAQHEGWCNGVKLTNIATGSMGSPTGNSAIGNASSTSTTQDFTGWMAGVHALGTVLPDDATMQALSSGRALEMLVEQASDHIWVPVSAGNDTSLTATPALTTSASATLTTAIPLAAAAQLSFAATGDLAQPAALAASPGIPLQATAALTTAIPLASAAQVQIQATASMEAQAAELVASAVVRAQASAALTTAIALHAIATARLTAAAALTVPIHLQAAMVINFSADADLTVDATVTYTRAPRHITLRRPRRSIGATLIDS